MIISDPLKVAFIHIPKCAGSTIRKGLEPYDSYRGRLGLYFQYPDGARQHVQHLPLEDVQTYFPEIFSKIATYQSYAIMREPHMRFASAVLQHLSSFQRLEMDRNSHALFHRKALEICERLDSGGGRSLDLANFQGQAQFLEVRGRRLVENIYRLDQLARFACDFKDRHGVGLDLGAQYNLGYLRNSPGMQMLKNLSRPIVTALLTPDLHRRLRARLRSWTGNSPAELYRRLFENRDVCSFVDRYYARDIVLYNSLSSR